MSSLLSLAALLKEHHWKLVTAESCTGGGLAYHLTDVAGSSEWFERGFVTYSNDAKQELLGVKKETLDLFGAVSAQTAQEMAEGALKNSHAQISVSITGIAGPGGGSNEKPVGTVWFGLSQLHRETQTYREIFSGNREKVRIQAIQFVVEKLILILKR